MKVVIIGPAHPLRGGIAHFNEALARAFQNEGHEVQLVSFSLQYPNFLFPGKTQFDEGHAPADLRIKTMINSVNPISWFATASYINDLQPDLVIVRYWLPFMAPALGTICRRLKKNCPVIAITDNIIPHEKRPGDGMLTSWFVKSVDGFVAMSRSVLKELEQFTPTKHKIFSPHPVYEIFGDKIPMSLARKNLGLDTGDKIILFFGFIRHYKGLDLLLEAMAHEGLSRENVKLLVAGEFYEDEAPYKTIIEKHGLQNRVILHGHYIPGEEVKNYFCAANLVAQTYRHATQSGVTQIAYHFERPMLVTDVGGLAEIVENGKCGFVTPPEPGAIGEALFAFFNQTLEPAFTAEVARQKSRFTWKAMVNAIISVKDGLKG